ncbi:MAG: serine--tRNA ligase [Verrucomicrobia bacterium]|nr:serine--tRNA ligase [Verrucomicrobiota bacterium]
MLDIKRVREKETEVRKGLESRGHTTAAVDEVLALDQKRRTLLVEVEALKNQRNTTSKEIGILRKKGADTGQMQATVRETGDRIAKLDDEVRDVDTKLKDLLLSIPNIPYHGIPVGQDKTFNRIARHWGEKRNFDFKPKPHVELGEKLGVFDFARATKITGAGFPLYIGAGARLQRALIQFMLDLHISEHGYLELWPPSVVNSASMVGTGQLPKMAEEMYHVTLDDLWLIPTAEVPVTNYFRDEIIERKLPVYLTAYTPCFRREAGAAGKETRGIIRVHQFDKVEMVKFVEPETSYDELESLVKNAEDVLQRLGLHYRVLELCTGDISFAAAKCYDIELWAPGQNDWLEVSSCSNFEDFQARRAGIRYRDKDGKVRHVHTLNGSGVALARLVVAILENGQQADGSVVLPEVIVPYMGGVSRLAPAGEAAK